MKQTKLNIVTKTEKYPIIIGSNLTSSVSKIFKSNSIDFDKCLIVVDKNVPKKFVSNIKKSLKNKSIFVLFFNASEKNKNINSVNKILEVLLNKNFSRNDVLISLGGGITGDVSGFAASLFKRGLKFVNIPTTLLAQVDSSIGGKTGINSKYGKNLIGSFYQPSLVLSDIQFLKSLSKREIICGYGEILKHSLIENKKFFIFLNKNLKKILSLSSPFIEKAIDYNPRFELAYVNLGSIKIDLDKLLEAEELFLTAIQINENYSYAYRNLFRLYEKTNNIEKLKK